MQVNGHYPTGDRRKQTPWDTRGNFQYLALQPLIEGDLHSLAAWMLLRQALALT